MYYIADLHLHSKYSRATSKDLGILTNAQWARWKGIDVVGTGDFTHPLWLAELKQNLAEDPEREGLFKIKNEKFEVGSREKKNPRFMLTVETAHIYSCGGKTRRIHLITFAPDFSTVEKIQQALLSKGVKISSDGRPTMGMACPEYMDLVLTINENCLVIPAHVWTPWYSLYGSNSGFDSMEECFQEFTPFIYAIETGLSSDPIMNWRIKELDHKSIVSFSDAHSPSKLGREVTVFKLKGHQPSKAQSDFDLGYYDIVEAIKQTENSRCEVAFTVEFYPAEGKYHYTGHRNCGLCQSPTETATRGEKCPVCGKNLTIGVMHRVDELAGRKFSTHQLSIFRDNNGVKWINTPKGLRPGYVMLVPLQEILAEVCGVGVKTKTVQAAYQRMITRLGPEFHILLEADLSEISSVFDSRTAEALRRVRAGELKIEPGYDGKYGEVKIFGEKDSKHGLGSHQVKNSYFSSKKRK